MAPWRLGSGEEGKNQFESIDIRSASNLVNGNDQENLQRGQVVTEESELLNASLAVNLIPSLTSLDFLVCFGLD